MELADTGPTAVSGGAEVNSAPSPLSSTNDFASEVPTLRCNSRFQTDFGIRPCSDHILFQFLSFLTPSSLLPDRRLAFLPTCLTVVQPHIRSKGSLSLAPGLGLGSTPPVSRISSIHGLR